MSAIRLKRAYDPPAPEDGFRLLVDRIWPRGVSKAGAAIDHWLKDVAPSAGLRRWFGHDPAKWPEFRSRYRAELRANPEPVRELRSILRQHRTVTLLFAARDSDHNNAVVLLETMQGTGAEKPKQTLE